MPQDVVKSRFLGETDNKSFRQGVAYFSQERGSTLADDDELSGAGDRERFDFHRESELEAAINEATWLTDEDGIDSPRQYSVRQSFIGSGPSIEDDD